MCFYARQTPMCTVLLELPHLHVVRPRQWTDAHQLHLLSTPSASSRGLYWGRRAKRTSWTGMDRDQWRQRLLRAVVWTYVCVRCRKTTRRLNWKIHLTILYFFFLSTVNSPNFTFFNLMFSGYWLSIRKVSLATSWWERHYMMQNHYVASDRLLLENLILKILGLLSTVD